MKKDKNNILNILSHKCPKCNVSYIYTGILALKDNCPSCNFNLKDCDVGDGPAFFAMCITMVFVSIFIIIIEMFVDISPFMHLVIWTPIIIIMSIYFLRIIKTIFIYVEYIKIIKKQ